MLPHLPLPTDNLYKFMTLLGITAAVGGALLNFQGQEDLVRQFTTKEAAGYINEVPAFESAISELNQAISDLNELKDSQLLVETSQAYRAFNRQMDSITQRLDDLDAKLQMVQTVGLAKVKWGNILFWTGLFLAGVNYVFWSIFHQRHQDRIAKLLVEKTELEIDQLRTEEAELT